MTARVEAQMPDSSTSRASLNMQQTKIRDGMVVICQYYQNELRIDIASMFVSFVRRQYPRDTQRQVEALYLKLYALDSVFERLQPVQMREYGVTANVLLSLIERMKHDAPLSKRYLLWVKASAYYVHGRIALNEGTEESARRAVIHFHLENQLEVNESIGDVKGIAMAQANIAIAKSKFEDGDSEELLRYPEMCTNCDVYELCVAEFGEGNEYTIDAGKSYAINLQIANRTGRQGIC